MINIVGGMEMGIAPIVVGDSEAATKVDTSWIRIARILRIVRAFRVIGRVRSLRMLVTTLTSSIPAAFAILILYLILLTSYSTIGVIFFHNFEHPEGKDDPRGFKNIEAAMLTMFQLNLGGWDDTSWSLNAQFPGSIWFVLSFMVVSYYIVMNMLVAIYVRKMTESINVVNEEDKSIHTMNIEKSKALKKGIEDINAGLKQNTSRVMTIEKMKRQLKLFEEIRVDTDKIQGRDDATMIEDMVEQVTAYMDTEVNTRLLQMERHAEHQTKMTATILQLLYEQSNTGTKDAAISIQ